MCNQCVQFVTQVTTKHFNPADKFQHDYTTLSVVNDGQTEASHSQRVGHSTVKKLHYKICQVALIYLIIHYKSILEFKQGDIKPKKIPDIWGPDWPQKVRFLLNMFKKYICNTVLMAVLFSFNSL